MYELYIYIYISMVNIHESSLHARYRNPKADWPQVSQLGERPGADCEPYQA